MATASPAPTPNPNAMRFQLDTKLPGTINFKDADDAADHPFARAVFETEGVAAVFGVNDFVTITREPDADWDAIVEGVQAAAAAHL
jgi:scaffold Nfu/NifU family protein